MTQLRRCAVGVVLGLALMAGRAEATSITVVGGILTGATGVGVEVGGVTTFYDVTFQDGTCVALFGDCDVATDFVFQDEVSAQAASVALLTQVFVDGADAYGTDPTLTNGCQSTDDYCDIWTPYGLVSSTGGASFFVLVRGVENSIAPSDDETFGSGLFDPYTTTYDTGNLVDGQNKTYALWQPALAVPEPEIYAMLGMGLGLLGWVGRRRKLKAAV